MDFKDRTIVVTGAGGLIGRATVAVLLRSGAKVLMVERTRKKLDEALAEIGDNAGAVQTFVADCSKSVEVQAYVARALEWTGRIDGFFNNAGIEGKIAPISEYDESEWDRVIAVNLTGVFLGLRYVLPVMIRQGSGAIVNTGSIASERGLPLTPAYNATKHGVVGLTRTAAAENGGHGIRVNCVLPGMIDTPMLRRIMGSLFAGDVDAGLKFAGSAVPAGRVGTPEDIAEVVAFLLSDKAAFVNGASWEADGGALATMGNGG
ncbi:MAG: SDR family NAD(P)-dependent oxidoreductase [Rhizobiaceae bacterium]